MEYGFAVVGVIPPGTSAGSSAGSAVETVTTLPCLFCKGRTGARAVCATRRVNNDCRCLWNNVSTKVRML